MNTHYLADQVDAFLQNWHSSTMSVQASYEPQLLGTAGTLLANQQFFQGSTSLLIHADNLMEEELPAFLDAHLDRNPSCLLTMLTFQTDRPSSCGIVEIDGEQVVKPFMRK